MSLDDNEIFPDGDEDDGEEEIEAAGTAGDSVDVDADALLDDHDFDNIDEIIQRSDQLLDNNAPSHRIQKKQKHEATGKSEIRGSAQQQQQGQQRRGMSWKKEEERETLRKQVEKQVTEVKQLLSRYHNRDLKSVELKQPALAKIKHIDEILEKLSKQGVQREFIEQRGLDFLTQWLDKIPNGPEPSVSLRKKLLHFIYELPVQRQHFNGIQLGKVIYKISEKSEVKELKTLASKVVEKWSKILNSKARHDLDYADEDEER